MDNIENWYFEKKFLVPNKSIRILHALLDHYFVSDPDYGVGTNNTIYYDTQNLSDYFDGINGASNRKKIRVRYYETDGRIGPINIEVKYKTGSMTGKFRSEVEEDNFELRHLLGLKLQKLFMKSSNDILYRLDLENYLPKVRIQYLRKRFFCPVSGLRVNVDNQLCAPEHYPNGFNPVGLNNMIEGSIVEIKGIKEPFLPKSIENIGLKNLALSKYCFFMSSILSRTKLYPKLDFTSDLARVNGWHCYASERNF